MEKIYTSENELLDFNSLSLLSTKGSEVVVYQDDKLVYKIYKKDYQLEHKNEQELEYLSSIHTARILMPKSKLYSNGNLIGYTMEYIEGEKDIYSIPMKSLLNELLIIKNDIEIISKAYIRLIDINKSNMVFNDGLYLIDPGNYFINNIEDLLVYLQNKEITEEDKINIIRNWNYNKINKLICELLFINNPDVDFYLLRKIIEFFDNERNKNNLLFDLKIYQEYFDKDLLVKEAINKFILQNIKIDEEEKQLILSLCYKNKKR